mmetsp:Transcript_93022/g.272246  ORF Transcript_93022/g.272246 Transcript_93022/m.272246 type:complete len:262 (-) Transcript_93022:1225-2010(-)
MKPKPRERREPSASRRSGLRTRLAFAMSSCAAFSLSFLRFTPLTSSRSSWDRCLTTSARSFEASTLVGRFRMLSRIGWMTKFGLLIRNFLSFLEAFRCSCSDFDSCPHFSEFSLISPIVKRYFHLAFSARAWPFGGFFSAVASFASVGVTAGFSTSLRPFRLRPKPSTAGSSRLSLFRTTAESSLSFLSAWASSAKAAEALSTSANLTKAEPLCALPPLLWSATSFTLRTLPYFRSKVFKSSSLASKGTLRTKIVFLSSTS